VDQLSSQLKGRHWDGKESLLDSLAEVITATKEFWEYRCLMLYLLI